MKIHHNKSNVVIKGAAFTLIDAISISLLQISCFYFFVACSANGNH